MMEPDDSITLPPENAYLEQQQASTKEHGDQLNQQSSSKKMDEPNPQNNDTLLDVEIPATTLTVQTTTIANNNNAAPAEQPHSNAPAATPDTPLQATHDDTTPLVGNDHHDDDKSWKISANSFAKQDLDNVKKKKRKVRKFYERQNEQVDEFLSLEQETKTQEEIDASNAANKRQELLEKIALRVSYASNIVLFLIKIAASILSLSLSVITSAIDSSLDLLSGFILFITNYIRRRKGKKDKYLYPVGKSRFEPLGFIMFSCVMCTASGMIVKEGVQGIVEGVISKYITVPPQVCIDLERKLDFSNPFFWVGVGVMGFTAVWKFLLYLFCRTITWSPAVQAYAMDHRNDVLSNIFLLISLTVSGLVWFMWWTDYAGAILLSLYIIQSWVRNSFEYIKKIVGTSADPEFLQRITFMSLNHHKQILKIDTVQAFYIGVNLYVEVDVVLHPETLLRDAHDIGEGLQIKIENLADVERAFVHLDYEYGHHRDSEHKRIE